MQQLADTPRATRYEMATEVVYRRLGDEGWRVGRTLNVSRSGVLFKSAPPVLPAATRIEFILLLPNLGHPGRSRVQCQGRVVRQCVVPEAEQCAMAATIETYNFAGIAPDPVPGRIPVV